MGPHEARNLTYYCNKCIFNNLLQILKYFYIDHMSNLAWKYSFIINVVLLIYEISNSCSVLIKVIEIAEHPFCMTDLQ
jgi:hypothetical protein